MTTTTLIIATIVLPGMWGWLVGVCGYRWCPVTNARRPTAAQVLSPRITDYDI